MSCLGVQPQDVDITLTMLIGAAEVVTQGAAATLMVVVATILETTSIISLGPALLTMGEKREVQSKPLGTMEEDFSTMGDTIQDTMEVDKDSIQDTTMDTETMVVVSAIQNAQDQ